MWGRGNGQDTGEKRVAGVVSLELGLCKQVIADAYKSWK